MTGPPGWQSEILPTALASHYVLPDSIFICWFECSCMPYCNCCNFGVCDALDRLQVLSVSPQEETVNRQPTGSSSGGKKTPNQRNLSRSLFHSLPCRQRQSSRLRYNKFSKYYHRSTFCKQL